MRKYLLSLVLLIALAAVSFAFAPPGDYLPTSQGVSAPAGLRIGSDPFPQDSPVVSQYIYDIASKAIDHNPVGNGWTSRSTNTFSNSAIKAITNPISDRAWRIEKNGTSVDLVHLFDELDSDVETIEILTLTNRNGVATTNVLKPFARISASSTVTGYSGGQRHTTGYPEHLVMRRSDSLTSRTNIAELDNSGIDSNADKWVWTLLQVTGTTVRVKVWEDGTTKPEAWTLSAIDANYSSGRAGLWTRRSGASGRYVYLAWYSVGINGASAPSLSFLPIFRQRLNILARF